MHQSVTTALRHLGLEPDTIRVYLACLKLGQGRAQEIAKAARLHRTLAYKHLDALAERGLVHITLSSGKRMYASANPTIISSLFKQQQFEIESILPVLLATYADGSPAKPQFRFYTDVAGVKTVMEEVLNCSSKLYRHIGSFHDKEFRRRMGNDYFLDWTKRRMARGVDHRSIRPMVWKKLQHEMDPLISGRGKKYLRDYRLLAIPEDAPVLVYLFDEKVAFIGARIGHAYAAVLESKDIYQILSGIFEILWAAGEVPEVPVTD